jgi:hypothetical protein
MSNIIAFPSDRISRGSINWLELAEELNIKADWRRDVASRFPHDARRNLMAAATLDNLAQACSKVPVCRTPRTRQFERAVVVNPDLWLEWSFQVGCILPPRTLDELLECCLRFAE